MLAICLLICGVSCAGQEQEEVFTVEYFADGVSIGQQTVKKGSTVTPPAAPSKDNYIFSGWTTDANGYFDFTLNTPVESDLTLHAKYSLDAVKLMNTVTTATIRGTVKVIANFYNKFLFTKMDEYTQTGSGVIFGSYASGRLLVLTNCHVAVDKNGRSYVDYQVMDYQGNVYAATVVDDPSAPGPAKDPSYDLACLSFDPGQAQFPLIPMAELDPEVGTDVVSVGYPGGQANAVTIGKVRRYESITLENSVPECSNVTFPVAAHSAVIDQGSSGGALLDANLKLVGINYATSTVNPEFNNGFAIPISKVREFLEKYVFYYYT